MRVITLEEHFWTGALRDANRTILAGRQPGELAGNLIDLGPRRLADIDEAGLDVQVLSVTAPAAQELEPAQSARRTLNRPRPRGRRDASRAPPAARRSGWR